ncbi:hypothetical protein IJJ37_01300 [Candidatus Saccharibacteria bacterium]|nr:hypothetical protein [Candidatus Saccharibacteria bacterium]
MKNKVIQNTIAKSRSRAIDVGRFAIFAPFAFIATITILSALALSSIRTSAYDQSVPASVSVAEACSLSAEDDGRGTVEIVGGTYNNNVKQATITATCNDREGFSIYAIGFGPNSSGVNTEGITDLVATSGSLIPTGTDNSSLPSTSGWAFKLDPVATSTYAPTILSDSEGSFGAFHTIPSTRTKVATYTGDVDVTGSSSVTATYAVGVSPYQTPDTYTGAVKYLLFHPNYANSNGEVSYMQD